jgi:tetratricopeptide (TPR) repeat protein
MGNDGGPGETDGGSLPRGTALGRYLVLEPIGAGGMGSVYAAYDPELDRKVALKLLHAGQPTEGSSGGQTRLVREAQAMARLSHPNVAAVYDVGTVGDRVFLAMELVEGVTLRAWLKQRKRPHREVLETVLAAGHGLAAAHASGLVHRDFKPDNVLVGEDGRVRVTDFGLARAVGEAVGHEVVAELSPSHPSGPLTTPLTQVGAVIGTPAYMAPEQLRGDAAGAPADQFAYCVTLHEALYGERPFESVRSSADTQTATETAAKDTDRGRPERRLREPPAGSGVPARLRKAILRGLADDPAARWPSMEALLATLARDPTRAWRRLAVPGAVLAAVAAFAIWRSAGPPPCAGSEARLAGVWDPVAKDAARKAIVAGGGAAGAATWASVEKALDAWAGSWTTMHREACEATRVRREQTEETLTLRMACLDRARGDLKALAGLFSRTDADTARHAVDAAYALAPVSSCADVASLAAEVPPPRDPEVKKRIDAISAQIAEARALYHAAKYREGRKAVQGTADAAATIGYRPLEGEAYQLLGELQEKVGEIPGAEKSLTRALVASEAGRSDVRVAAISNDLLWVVGYRLADASRSPFWEAHARAALERNGNDERSRSQLEKAVGIVLWSQGKYADALPHQRLALELAKKTEGAEHPDVAQGENNVGITLMALGEHGEALEHYQRARAINVKSYGEESPEVATSDSNLGAELQVMGRDQESFETFERAYALQKKTMGEENPETAILSANVASALERLGRYSEAEARIEPAVKILKGALGPAHPITAQTVAYQAGALLGLGRSAEALADCDQAIAAIEKAVGPEHAYLVEPLVKKGRALLELQKPAEAVAPLTRAVKLAGDGKADPWMLDQGRFALGRALWESKGDRARAVALSREAKAGFERAGQRPRELAAVEAWLAGHAAP